MTIMQLVLAVHRWVYSHTGEIRGWAGQPYVAG